MKIVVDHHRLGNIPSLEFYNPEAVDKLPVVIILHGFSGRKENNFMQGYHLAQRGYYAVAIDLHRHGESSEGEFVPSQVAPYLAEVISRSTAYIDVLGEVYAQHPIADGERIGLLGISLGGAVIYHYLPQASRQIKAVVALIAGALPFWPITMRKVMQIYPDFGLTEALVSRMEREVPAIPFLEGLADLPLLMQYGQDDPIVPIEEVHRLYQKVKGNYAHPERIELVEYPNTGHETPPAMFDRAWLWLDQYLKGN